MAKRNKTNFIIIVVVMILMALLILLLMILNSLKKAEDLEVELTNNISITPTVTLEPAKTIKDIIEEYGSVYIGQTGSIEHTVYVNFKNDLFDENGKSNKSYFYNIIEEIENIEDRTFYLKDTEKKIDISVIYNPATNTFKVFINEIDNYYDTVDGEIYVGLAEAEERKLSDLIMNNELIRILGSNSAFYARTELSTDEKEDLGNGYTSFQDGKILAKIQNGKALNVIFKAGYEEDIAYKIKVGTPLETIAASYPKFNFGSVRDGYLGYITEYGYLFFYENEVSAYPYRYKENTYFDDYISDYYNTGNFERLVSNFTDNWTSYFERNIDLEAKNFTISFPTRGIRIDIKNGSQDGITIYSNYYLSDKMKELVKAKKVTLDSKHDLVDIVEKSRREAM